MQGKITSSVSSEEKWWSRIELSGVDQAMFGKNITLPLSFGNV
jgi:hypothetical protein